MTHTTSRRTVPRLLTPPRRLGFAYFIAYYTAINLFYAIVILTATD